MVSDIRYPRDELYLYQGVFGQFRDLDRGASREIPNKMFGINLVYRSEIVDIFQKYRAFQDVLKTTAGFLQDRPLVAENLLRLMPRIAADQFAAPRVDTNLAGGEKEPGLAVDYCLVIGAQGLRGMVGVDDFFH